MLCLIFVLTLSCAPTFGQKNPSPPSCPRVCPQCPVCPPLPPGATVAPSVEDYAENLQSKTGWNLAVNAKGEVYGIRAVKGKGTVWDSYAVLEVKSRGRFQIRGIKSNLYIAMNDQGDVYAESNKESANTFWQQIYDGKKWRRYKWLKNGKDWYLAIQKNGKPRKGSLTNAKMNAAQFLLVKPKRPGGTIIPQPTTLPATWLDNPVPMTNDKHLNSRTGFRLAISPERAVYAEGLTVATGDDSYNVFSVYWSGVGRLVQLRGRKAGLYVAMDDRGVVYAESDRKKINTWWKVAYEGADQDETFEWFGNNQGWFLAIDKSGQLKKGGEAQKTQPDAHFVMFNVGKKRY